MRSKHLKDPPRQPSHQRRRRDRRLAHANPREAKLHRERRDDRDRQVVVDVERLVQLGQRRDERAKEDAAQPVGDGGEAAHRRLEAVVGDHGARRHPKPLVQPREREARREHHQPHQPEQEEALVQFQQEKLKIRKQLRDVRHQLDRDIELLGSTLKFINIALIPILMTLVLLGLNVLRLRRDQEARP